MAQLSLRQTLPTNAFKTDRKRDGKRNFLSQTQSKNLLDSPIKPEQLRVVQHVAASYDGTRAGAMEASLGEFAPQAYSKNEAIALRNLAKGGKRSPFESLTND